MCIAYENINRLSMFPTGFIRTSPANGTSKIQRKKYLTCVSDLVKLRITLNANCKQTRSLILPAALHRTIQVILHFFVGMLLV